jgi:hypothetical protein
VIVSSPIINLSDNEFDRAYPNSSHKNNNENIEHTKSYGQHSTIRQLQRYIVDLVRIPLLMVYIISRFIMLEEGWGDLEIINLDLLTFAIQNDSCGDRMKVKMLWQCPLTQQGRVRP